MIWATIDLKAGKSRPTMPCPALNRFYNRRLADSLRNIYKQHEPLFLARGGDLRPDVAAQCKTIREFDDAITRVTFGVRPAVS